MDLGQLSFKQLPPSKEKITDPKEIAKVYTRWRWRMFIGMYLGYMVFYFTRKNIAPALPLFGEKLALDIVQLGILSTVFYIVYGIGKFVSGLLADRSNIRTFMAFGLLCASIIHLFYGYLTSLYALVFFWGLNGAFQSMGFPPVAKALVHWFCPNERATKWALWSSSHTAGTFGIGILIAWILSMYSKGLLDWRAIFYIPGAIGVVTSLVMLVMLRDRPVSMGLPPIDKYKNVSYPVEKTKEDVSHCKILKKYVFTNPYLWALCFSYIFVYLIRFGTLDWATKFMYDVKGISEVKVALFWSLMPLGGIAGGIVAGYLADKVWGGRCAPCNVLYLILLIFSIWGFYVYAGPDNYFATGFYLLAIGFFVDGPQVLVGGVQVSRITVKEAVATACGLSGWFGYIGAAFSGVGLAYITKVYGWGGMYGACMISCVIAGGLMAITWNKEKEDHYNHKKKHAKCCS
ncbi:MAG: MFS transporter [Elusimicrobiaceae bacterium]|nr:MFS transporter [Elusimicrobiaceae bacterium]